MTKLYDFFCELPILKYKKKSTILRPEDEPQGIYFISKGFVRLYSLTGKGVELTLNIFKPGSCFPLTYALTDIPNSYFYETLDDAELFRSPKEDFIEFMNENNNVTTELNRSLLIGLNGILIRLHYLMLGTAYHKVANSILMLTRRFGETQKNGNVKIDFPVTHQEIANLSGLTRETVTLEIKKLETEGMIKRKGRTLVVKNPEKLRDQSLIYVDGNPLPYSF